MDKRQEMKRSESNYDIQTGQAQRLFLTFDQAEIQQDFGLRCDGQFLYINFVCREYAILRTTGEIFLADDGSKAGFNEVLSIFDMLCKGQGRPVLSGSWESLSRLGGFIGAGHSNSSMLDPYTAAFTGKTRELTQACLALGGKPMKTGDVSFLLPVFDFFPVWFQFWDGDEEEPASLRFLWDKNTLRYLHYETLWYIMMHILQQLLPYCSPSSH